MSTMYFFTDEGGQASGRFFLVCGLALEVGVDRARAARDLIDIENEPNGVGLRDWYSTKDHRTKRRYLQRALTLPALQGRLFSVVWREKPASYFAATVGSLQVAMRVFAKDKRSIIAHEGFTQGHRNRLGYELLGDFEIRAGCFKRDPLIRLADRMAGCLGVTLFGTQVNGCRFSNVPLDRIQELEK